MRAWETECCSRACNVSVTMTNSTLRPSAAARASAHAAATDPKSSVSDARVNVERSRRRRQIDGLMRELAPVDGTCHHGEPRTVRNRMRYSLQPACDSLLVAEQKAQHVVTNSTLRPSAAARASARASARAAKSARRRCSNTCPRWPAADAQHVPDQSHAVRVIHLGMVVRAGGGLLRVICAFLPLMKCPVDCPC